MQNMSGFEQLLQLGQMEKEFLLDIFFAFICGSLIGGERELRHKPAGISTQTLVITASMIFSFISRTFSEAAPTQIAAQIVSGVGFLGAGLILKGEDGKINNLTTAASVWYSASVGMALGFNLHFIALVASLYVVIVSRIPNIRIKLGKK